MAINRFSQLPPRRIIASAPLPAQVHFNNSMAQQAARVPRLANLHAGMAKAGGSVAVSTGRRR